MTGSAVQWLRDQLGIIPAGEIEALATSVPDNGGIYFVPAFSGLFAPYWRPMRAARSSGSRASTPGAPRARDARSDLLSDPRSARCDGEGFRRPLAVLKVDGGATVNNTLMQLQADILACPSCGL